jgi:hypothetical protein
MMKYILLLILSLLSMAIVQGLPVTTKDPGKSNCYSIPVGKSDTELFTKNDSLIISDDDLEELISNGFVVAPGDSYPIQVGAFRHKSNAYKVFRGIKHHSEINVRIIIEDGLYKVRIARYPYEEKSDIVPADYLEELLSNGFVIDTGDLYPIQVGAFRSKSNADKVYRRIKHQSEINARIIIEGGFYKVRMARYPDREKSGQSDTAAYSGKMMIEKQDSGMRDSLLFNSGYNYLLAPARSLSETSASAVNEMLYYKKNNPWLKRIKYFGESYMLVKALIITILFSIGSMIAMLVIILLNRRRIEREEKLTHYLSEKYQSLIVDYLFGNTNPDDFRSIASDNYRRQVLIDQMIDLSINLKGEEGKKLLNLYKYLGLDKDSIARANDHRWHKKVKGFRELAFMNIKDANVAIYKALNSSNEILRMEAQIALVRLSDKDPFEFLSYLKRPFSLWEQITLHDLIMQHSIPKPSFKKWLSSPNYTVVLFALRMLREFKQTDAEEDIKNLLLHQSPEVRLLAVEVAGDLHLSSTIDIMKRMYKNQEYKICLEILRSIGKMPDISMMGFLKLVLDKEDDVQLQIEATKSIEKMGEEGVKALVKMMESEYKNYSIIVRHVLDRRIN